MFSFKVIYFQLVRETYSESGIIRNWLIWLWKLTNPKICSWPARGTQECWLYNFNLSPKAWDWKREMMELQSEGWQPWDSESQCSVWIWKQKNLMPQFNDNQRGEFPVSHRNIYHFVAFRLSKWLNEAYPYYGQEICYMKVKVKSTPLRVQSLWPHGL